MNTLFMALEPEEHSRLRRILARDSPDSTERERMVHEAVNRVEADLRALRIVLGMDQRESGGDDESTRPAL